jgi:hypothetical protein
LNSTHWRTLIPDGWGYYADGTWLQVAMRSIRDRTTHSAVLAGGQVFVPGGEDSGDNNNAELLNAEIYYPTRNQWFDITLHRAYQILAKYRFS